MGSAVWPFEFAVREIVTLLCRGDYYAVEQLTAGERLSAGELAQAVDDYPGTLQPPPSWEAAPLDVVPVTSADSPTWSVVVPLWTVEEGLSDLSLELTIRERREGGYIIGIDDLHVL
jgi:hypothetical protein